ncbi:MAG: hypothetical protein ACR2N2_04800 [Acidimicrobiia bacterium]
MAVAVQEPTTSVDFVTGAVVANHRARVEPSVELSLAELIDSPIEVGSTRVVMAPELRSVEVVLDTDTPLFSMAEVAWGLHADGHVVNVLVSLDRLGDAHHELRGTPCTLQGWWIADDAVHFAGYEIP